MARATSDFVCQQCGYQSPSFLGRCPNCGEWNSFVETAVSTGARGLKARKQNPVAKPLQLSEVAAGRSVRVSTGVGELDRVLGGGVVSGMAVLLAGEPGIGKSTLLLELARHWSGKVVYVAGEESPAQIRIRADRLGVAKENLFVLPATDVDTICASMSGEAAGTLVIVDSIQTLTTTDLTGAAGTVGQVRECALRLISLAKERGLPIFLVGHVTKEGAIAGPKVLEHMVDTVLELQGERFSGLRLIRTAKNRFGATDEVGIFRMTDSGLTETTDLGVLGDESLGRDRVGSCLTVAMEGTRPMVLEIQALTTSTPLPVPRRVANGIDSNRLQMIVAVIQKRLSLPLYKEDIYINVSGGVRIEEPAADLPVALAILSSFRNKALAAKTVAVGELDLLGNIRPVNFLEKRIKEAKKLGLGKVLVPGQPHSLSDLKV